MLRTSKTLDLAVALAMSVLVVGCWEVAQRAPSPPAEPSTATAAQQADPVPETQLDTPKILEPVPFWAHGKTERMIEASTAAQNHLLLLDLGEDWTPYLFTDGLSSDATPLANTYRPTYLALARGHFGQDPQGERAQEDKYLELYGIPPTLALSRTRMRETSKRECIGSLDLAPLIAFEGFVTYESNQVAKRRADDFVYLRGRVHKLLQRAGVATPQEIPVDPLDARDKDVLTRYLREAPTWHAIDAAQQRLKCEGYFEGLGRFQRGGLDWATHEALAKFERRHRVYSWGYIGKDSLVPLRQLPMETERQAVLRVLVERAVHTMGVLEDGSTSTKDDGSPRTWKGTDGRTHQIPNLVAALRESLIAAFGLQTPESTLAWLDALGELPTGERRIVAIAAPKLPEYYDGDMQLTLDYDRGDIWYDFPYGDRGEELAQPVTRRPQVTVSVLYHDQKIPLARFGTTIGGWRKELADGATMWKYKNSPTGPRAWEEIVAAPVWLPPDTTPPAELLKKNRKKKLASDPDYLVNYHETGPSYASAYGLVAAYHREFFRRADGTVILGRDEGIRTHGSVDYMSIMRRHSHGCHRLHNHIALRMMSFVLAHRPHERRGHAILGFKKQLLHDEKSYDLDIKQGGYVFKLSTPLFVNVEEGRVRGEVKQPLEFAIPKYDANFGLYLMPDATPVRVRGAQLLPIPLPATLPDGGVLDPALLPRAPSAPDPLQALLTDTVLGAQAAQTQAPSATGSSPAAPKRTAPPLPASPPGSPAEAAKLPAHAPVVAPVAKPPAPSTPAPAAARDAPPAPR